MPLHSHPPLLSTTPAFSSCHQYRSHWQLQLWPTPTPRAAGPPRQGPLRRELLHRSIDRPHVMSTSRSNDVGLCLPTATPQPPQTLSDAAAMPNHIRLTSGKSCGSQQPGSSAQHAAQHTLKRAPRRTLDHTICHCTLAAVSRYRQEAPATGAARLRPRPQHRKSNTAAPRVTTANENWCSATALSQRPNDTEAHLNRFRTYVCTLGARASMHAVL